MVSRLDVVPAVVPLTTADPSLSTRHRLARWARRTEGRLSLLLVLLVLLGIATGISGAAAVGYRLNLLDGMPGDASLPALELYVSLADADATASTAFLAEGAGQDELGRFRRDVARATAALTEVAAVTRSPAIEVLSTDLPVYADQIEDAVLAGNRSGLPPDVSSRLAGNYLREPATSMRASILPAAHMLWAEQLDRLGSAQRAAAVRPWLALGLGTLLIACLVLVQVLLTRWTRRLLNPFLLGATAAALAAFAWLAAATSLAAGYSEASRDGIAELDGVAEARAAALLARSDDALILITRDNGPEDFVRHYDQTRAVLVRFLTRAKALVPQPEAREAVDLMVADLQDLLAAHRQLVDLDRAGRTSEAVTMLTGPLAELFRGFDDQAAYANRLAATDRLASNAVLARDALKWTDLGAAVLAGLVIACSVLGMWRRIGEYRMP